MKNSGYVAWLVICLFGLIGCRESVTPVRTIDSQPSIYPDYKAVTIPYNIAPLNFMLTDSVADAFLTIDGRESQLTAFAKEGRFLLPEKSWKRLLQTSKGEPLTFTVMVKKDADWEAYQPFDVQVSNEAIDPYLAYRIIPPGYELWNKMGIYQRNLESFEESPVMENKLTGNNCMNCHSFCMNDPEKMLFHMRQTYPGTVLVDGSHIEYLDTKTPETVSSLVYPFWHPSGKYIAFSVNETKQGFHKNDANRVEVYDESSDVVVYDIEKREIVTSKQLFSKEAYETFPAFSPDGKTLYFCSAEARPIPAEYDQVRYHLCAISFDPETRQFGQQVDTLHHATQAGTSASFPRVSPDGRYLAYTTSGYGNFSIWHKDADLQLIDLLSKENKSTEACNSDDVESYHAWSSNGRWLVFSSRREDGLYTHPYIVYIDESGTVSKPFVLPQEQPDFYKNYMYSFNIPELLTGKIKSKSREIALKVKKEQPIRVKFAKR